MTFLDANGIFHMDQFVGKKTYLLKLATKFSFQKIYFHSGLSGKPFLIGHKKPTFLCVPGGMAFRTILQRDPIAQTNK